MAPLNEIVEVQISRGSVNISQVGFGTIMILGGNAAFKERLQFFSDLSSVADALLTGTEAPEYKAAQAIFSQNPKCTRLAIGHRGADLELVWTGTITGGSIVAVVNGYSITQAFDTSRELTLDGLATKIAEIPGIDSTSYSEESGIMRIAVAAGSVIGLSITLQAYEIDTLAYTVETTNTESVTDALNAIVEYNNDWYGLIVAARGKTDVEAAAAWVEAAIMKVFCTASADLDMLDAEDTSSIAYTFKTLGYLKTQVRYSANAATEYPDAAMLGRILPYDPGSYTAAFKNLAGVATDLLTTTQRATLFDKYVDVYEYVGGTNITRNGKVSGNEYLDVMIFIDWLQARCTEAIFQILVSNLRIPYTEAGIASVENALTQPLKAGQNAGGISPTAYNEQEAQIGGFYIEVPELQNIPTIDKTSRTLNNVKFVAFLAGAIQIVKVRGTVAL